jgi:hypothetical protein
MANQSTAPTYGATRVKVTLLDANKKSFSFHFILMSLGKYNYAQILGIDWKNALEVVTFNHESKLWVRALDVEAITRVMHMKLYHTLYSPTQDSGIEEYNAKKVTKDIKLVSARLMEVVHQHTSDYFP